MPIVTGADKEAVAETGQVASETGTLIDDYFAPRPALGKSVSIKLGGRS